MAVILSILVALHVLVAGVWYSKSYVDHQIQTNQEAINEFQATPERMNTLKKYNFKTNPDTDQIIIIDDDEIAD